MQSPSTLVTSLLDSFTVTNLDRYPMKVRPHKSLIMNSLRGF